MWEIISDGSNEYDGRMFMSGYIMDLRKVVGHRTLMQCAASVIIVFTFLIFAFFRSAKSIFQPYCITSLQVVERYTFV